MEQDRLCPFSKPIIGNWCQCPHARMMDRCSGKMWCAEADKELDRCSYLVDLLRDNSRFVLALSDQEEELTHTQLMKIRCGGLKGMQRFLGQGNDEPPAVLEIRDQIVQRYGDLSAFPFHEIMPDIKGFSHRKKLRNR